MESVAKDAKTDRQFSFRFEAVTFLRSRVCQFAYGRESELLLLDEPQSTLLLLAFFHCLSFSSTFLRPQHPAESRLQFRNERFIAKDGVARRCRPDGFELAGKILCSQPLRPIPNRSDDWQSRIQQRVRVSVGMCPGTRPSIILRAIDDMRADGIPLNVADCGSQMRLIEDTGIEAPLPEVAR